MPTTNKKVDSQSRPIYVIVGKDEFLVATEFQNLLDNLVAGEQKPAAVLKPDPDKTAVAEILDELRTPDFFSSTRVVAVKDAGDFISENRSLLERYFDNPSPCGILVLMVSSWHPNTKLAKKLSKTGKLITVQDLNRRQLPQYLVSYANRKHGKGLSRPAAELLVELAGNEPGRLVREVDKLAVFAESERTITPQHVEALTGHNRLFDAFEVIDAMTRGEPATATMRLRKMFAADRNTAFTVVGAFAYHFRRMFRGAAMLKKGKSPNQIASELRLWRGKEENFFKQVRSMGIEKIGSALAELARIDYEIKTGQATVQVAIEKLIFKLAS